MVKPLVNQYGAALQRCTTYFDASATGSYEINRDKGRRRNPRTGKAQEHITYNQRHRDKAQGTIYDLIRNDITAQWAFKKLLDYTTVHYFQSSTGDSVLDDDIEYIVEQWSRRENCDIGKRHSLGQMIRLRAAGEYLDGDGALLKLSTLKLQGIEGDNIRSPDYKTDTAGMPEIAKTSIQGLILDKYNAVKQYVICTKTNNPGRYKFASLVDAENVIYGGNFFRFDQIRGVPVLNAAANTAQDVKEIDEYQLQKVKMHAMHALVFKSDAALTGYNEIPLPGGIAGNGSGTVSNTPQYQFEMDSGLKMELNPGDSVDMLESKTPSREYKEFSELMMRKFFLTWEGLPYEFFNCGNASYSAMKHIRAEFKFGIQQSEQKNRDIRYSVLEWILPALLAQNKIRLPKKFAGDKIFRYLSWLPQAEPWLEEDREVSAALARIDGGLSNLEDEAARRGKNAYDVLRGTARSQSYIRKTGLVLTVGMPGANLWNADKMNNSKLSTAAGSPPADPSPADASTSGGGTSQPDNNGVNNDSTN